MALSFAKAGAGGIVICARSTHELDEVALKISAIDNSIKASIVTCDVTDEESVKSLAKTIEKDHGRLDVLINNAGHLDAGWQPIT
jgi:NAD(P)-dependent dehydrogenase (short-subunit alcohol dehydrogenase family)